jgi:AraC family transcriptional regulator
MTDHATERFRQVLAYIDGHLDDDLSLDVLARVARYSAFHFHRRFAALTGMGVYRYVQLSRFKRAAWQAAFRPDVSVTSMALDAGYDSAEAFSRAFRQRLGQSPAVFRASPDWAAWAAAWHDLDHVRRFHMGTDPSRYAVQIVDFPPTPVARLSHIGPPALIGDTIRRFIDWRRSRALSPAKAATWNIVYDDPDLVAAADYRMDLCVTCAEVPENEAGVTAWQIPGGRCAVLRHVGSDALLADAVRFLYGEWLTASDEALRDAPLFFRRVVFFPDVPEHEATTDIYLPLASLGATAVA